MCKIGAQHAGDRSRDAGPDAECREALCHRASRRPSFLKQSRCFYCCAVGVESQCTSDSRPALSKRHSLRLGGQHGEESSEQVEDEVGGEKVDGQEDHRQEVRRQEEEVSATHFGALAPIWQALRRASRRCHEAGGVLSPPAAAPAQVDDGGRRRSRGSHFTESGPKSDLTVGLMLSRNARRLHTSTSPA